MREKLIAVCVGVYLVQIAVPTFTSRFWLWGLGVADGQTYRLVTSGFLHGSVTHLLFNGLMLYFFGCELEELWGSRRFLVFQIAAVLMGGLFVVATALLGLGASLVLGASAIMAGCAIAWGLSFPDREMYFFFVVRLKGLGTPVVPSKYGQKYASGLVQGPTCPVFICRGIGLSVLPLRLGVTPEIAVLELAHA